VVGAVVQALIERRAKAAAASIVSPFNLSLPIVQTGQHIVPSLSHVIAQRGAEVALHSVNQQAEAPWIFNNGMVEVLLFVRQAKRQTAVGIDVPGRLVGKAPGFYVPLKVSGNIAWISLVRIGAELVTGERARQLFIVFDVGEIQAALHRIAELPAEIGVHTFPLLPVVRTKSIPSFALHSNQAVESVGPFAGCNSPLP